MEENKENKTPEKKGRRVIPILTLLSLVTAGLWFWSSHLEFGEKAMPVTDHEENHFPNDSHGHEEEGHDGHDDGHGHSDAVRLSEEDIKEFGIKVVRAEAGTLSHTVDLPGEVRANGDRLAHIVPRVAGVARKVLKGLGDSVKKGEVMAVLDSRELSDAKAAFLAATERVALALTNFNREESLWKKKITSEQEYLEAKQVLAEAQIQRRSAEQKLRALGFSNRYLKDLPNQPEESFTQYKIRAPFSGTVIEKHITLGEVLKDDASAFIVADLSSVWVDLSVYQKDLAAVAKDQRVIIEAAQGDLKTEGKISYLGPVVGEATRTALARVVLPNPDGRWRPGLFVNAKVAVGSLEADVVVPKSALQKIDGRTVLFVQDHGAFSPRPVQLGRSDDRHVEIVEGLFWGDPYVAGGAFTLRTQLGKGDLDDGHNH